MKVFTNHKRGAVLVVTLIMLSMITFLVVAFVGFSRLEYSTVESGMGRFETSGYLELAELKSQEEVVGLLEKNENHGALVTQNIDGLGVQKIEQFGRTPEEALAALMSFSTNQQSKARPPVFVDRNGDGIQEDLSFYLNLNNATNSDGGHFQPTYTNDFGRSFAGDPHWIGILEDENFPHGPQNRYLGRYASLTVPASKALSIRYNHNAGKPLGRIERFDGGYILIRFGELAGVSVAPNTTFQVVSKMNGRPVGRVKIIGVPVIGGLSRVQFRIAEHGRLSKGDYVFQRQVAGEILSRFDRFYRDQGRHPNEINLAAGLAAIDGRHFRYQNTSPYAGSSSSPGGNYSAFSFSSAMEYFNHGIEDIMHLRFQPPHFNELISTNRLRNDFDGVASRQLIGMHNWLKSVSLENGLTPESTAPYAFYNFMELFSSVPRPTEDGGFDAGQIRSEVVVGNAVVSTLRNAIQFLTPHGLKNGDKIEQRFYHKEAAPFIFDPIFFPVNIYDGQAAVSVAALKDIAENGLITTAIAHRLLPGDRIEFLPVGDTKIFPLIYNGADSDGNVLYRPLREVLIGNIISDTKLRIILPNQVGTVPKGQEGIVGWGVLDPRTNKYFRSFGRDPGAQLPAIFDRASYQLRYRYTPWELDPLPYFVRVLDADTVSLHRSAELNESSRIIFNEQWNNPSDYAYRANTKTFEWLRQNDKKIRRGWVRFANKIPQGVSKYDVFEVRMDSRTGNIYLYGAGGSLLEVPEANYELQPVYKFGHDLLAEAVEKMAGLMLNESIDVTGGNKIESDGRVTPGGVVEHFLGGQLLAKSDPFNPSALELGLGGHPEAMGLWHEPRRGIPMNESADNYTREVERIVQVAANIADLRSGYFGQNLPIAGKEVLTCEEPGLSFLPFGNYGRDHDVSAGIRVRSGYAGMILCMRTDQPNPWDYPMYEVSYRVSDDQKHGKLLLWLWKEGQRKPVASSRDLPVIGNGEVYRLRVKCDMGRHVTASFSGGGVEEPNCISYEHDEALMGQAACLANIASPPQGRADFFELTPGVMPAEVAAEVANNKAWSHTMRSGGDTLPTAWRGVFRRDASNKVYLTGFQRWRSSLLRRDSDWRTSWYQRKAPTVIGIKDRHNEPGKGLVPAFNEFSLRAVYNVKQKEIIARMAAEVHLPGQLDRSFYGNVNAVVESGVIKLIYTDASGGTIEKRINLQPGIAFYTPPQQRPVTLDEGRLPYHKWIPLFDPYIQPNLQFKKLTGGIEYIDGQGSLTDIHIEQLALRVEGQIVEANLQSRAVDYLNTTVTLSAPVPFANSDPVQAANLDAAHRGLNEWGYYPKWEPKKNYGTVGNNQNPRRVFHNDAFYALRVGGLPGDAKNPSPDRGGNWLKLPWEVRMLDISWQVNDPLVNSRGDSYGARAYVPGGWPLRPRYDKDGRRVGWEPVPGTQENTRTWYRRHWLPLQAAYDPSYGFGVNLGSFNHASRPWGISGGDASIQDPRGVGAYNANHPPHLDWRFPDLARTPLKTVGWLGQVHRGTPWQTLYLKSKKAGLAGVTAYSNIDGIITVPNHSIQTGDQLQLMGKCPDTWKDLRLNPNAVRVDSEGNILLGELEGFAERLDENRIRVWPTQSLSAGGVDVLSDLGNVLNTEGLLVQNIQYWQNWAGSQDTQPVNDHRLLEVFRVDPGTPVRGQFSVNNDRPEAWGALLSGLSAPMAAIKYPDGSANPMPRIIGANDSDFSPEREVRVDMHDGRWGQLVSGVNQTRGKYKFTRGTDILKVPQLSTDSPYLPVVWQHLASGFADEFDIERLPQQLLSLTSVDNDPIYETYTVVERLRPALRLRLPQYSGPAVIPPNTKIGGKDVGGTVLNYAVAGSEMRRQVYRLDGYKEFHRSIKNGHPGYHRGIDGNLRPLPPLRPVVIQSSTMQMN